MVYKINHTPEVAQTVTAYNGDYVLDHDGNKVLTNNPNHPKYDSSDPNKERYLVIEANTKGEHSRFDGRILVEDEDSAAGAKINLDKSTTLSKQASSDVHFEIFDSEINLKSGSLKSMTENLTTSSGNNLISEYKTKLDQFAKALSDMSASYLQKEDESYVYGIKAVDVYEQQTADGNRVDIGLFSGSTVSSLSFNSGKVDGLTQDDLDYLATLQWKTDVDIDETNNNPTSFSKFNQALKVKIAEDKENNDWNKETQSAVVEQLSNTYEKITKVDKDEELMNLMKYQAAYEANAKIITMIDQLLQTILGMKK